MSLTLLALFAHPDDESFATGGTLALYARRGVRVVLGCATRGEAGIVHDDTPPPEDMGQAREKELRCACRVLGIRDLRFLGYRDSGTAGTPDNNHPNALIRADPEQVITRICDLMREFRPQVVVTFGGDGGSGHPDHVAIHRYATAAWHRAGDSARYPDLAQDPPRKLYYVTRPQGFYRQFRLEMWRRGLLPEPPAEAEPPPDTPAQEITTTVAVQEVLPLKFQALRCHRTQIAPQHPYLNLPADMLGHLAQEYFVLAAARGVQVRTGETDLFEGLVLEG